MPDPNLTLQCIVVIVANWPAQSSIMLRIPQVLVMLKSLKGHGYDTCTPIGDGGRDPERSGAEGDHSMIQG